MRKIVFITGASSGLGEGMAREFAARGCDLALMARRMDRLEALREELLRARPEAKIVLRQLDVLDSDQVFAAFQEMREALGGCDRVIVNAGVASGAPIGKGGFARNKAVIETNFIAALAQFEAAMEIFRAQNRGHLVAISSMSAFRGLRGGLAAYAASKAGLAVLAEGLRAEMLRKTDIKISTIYPGYILTEMNAKADPKQTPFIIDARKGARLIADAIEKEWDETCVPWWPWAPLRLALKAAPLSLLNWLS